MSEPAAARPRARAALLTLGCLALLVGALAAALLWLRPSGGGSADGRAGAAGSAGGTSPRAGGRTLVVVVWDSVCIDLLPPYGYEVGTAPELARLAAEGVVFRDHLPSGPGTNAALASLLTGRYPRHHGVGALSDVGRHRLPEECRTLAEELAAAGWTTVAATALAQLEGAFSGLAQGFDVYAAPPLGAEAAGRSASEVLADLRPLLAPHLASAAPLLLVVHLADARHPRSVDGPRLAERIRAHLEPFRERSLDLAAALDKLALTPAAARREVEGLVLRRRGDPVREAYLEALYDERVARLDAALGELRGWLEQAGRWQDAAVVVCGSRSEPPGADFSHDGTRWAEDPGPRLNAPLVVRLPRGWSTIDPTGITQDVDLAPTLLELAGLPGGFECDGRSWIAHGEARPPEPAATPSAPAATPSAPAATRVALMEELDFGTQLAIGPDTILRSRPESLLDSARWPKRRSELANSEEIALLRDLLRAHPPMGLLRVSLGERASARLRAVLDGEGCELVAPYQLEQRFGERPPGQGPRPFQSLDLEPGAQEAALARASRRSPEMAFVLGVEQGALSERDVAVGPRRLSQLDLPLLPLDPSVASGESAGADGDALLEVRAENGIQMRLSVGGEAGRAVRLTIDWLPLPEGSTVRRVEALGDAQVAPHALREEAWVVTGTTPLELRVERRPREKLGLALFLDGERVPGTRMTYNGRPFARPEKLSFGLPAAAWCDRASYLPAGAAPPADAVLRVELLEPRPVAATPARPSPEERALLRKLGRDE